LRSAFLAAQAAAYASVDDAISRAMEAMDPYVKQGYVVRQDEVGRRLGRPNSNRQSLTLCSREMIIGFAWEPMWKMPASRSTCTILEGKLVENDAWQKGHFASRAGYCSPHWYLLHHRGGHFLGHSNAPHWAMVYGYK